MGRIYKQLTFLKVFAMDNNTDKLRDQMIELVTKIVKKELNDIIRTSQNVFTIATIESIDYSSKTAIVKYIDSGTSGSVSYPSNFTSSEIGVGQRVVIANTDTFVSGSKYIIGAFGGF